MLRTNWGFAVVLAVVAAGCGDIEVDDSARLTRGTDVSAALLPDAGTPSPDVGSAGGAPGAGGMAGAGGAGAGGVTGAGGALGAGGAPTTSYTCDDLLGCCDSLSGSLKAMCLAVYNGVMTGGVAGTCGSALSSIKANGLCQ